MPTSTLYRSKDNLFHVGGGRLSRAAISDHQKYPILMIKFHLTDIFIRHTHLTARLIREAFWIPSVTQRIKKCIWHCTICIRWKAQTVTTTMGDLPAVRVIPAPVFSQIGVDLAGPFVIRASRIMFDKEITVWVAVFICMVSKAVHLEICADLSTENFLAAFSWFCSRRGCPKSIASDHGTNFVGADRQIKR